MSSLIGAFRVNNNEMADTMTTANAMGVSVKPPIVLNTTEQILLSILEKLNEKDIDEPRFMEDELHGSL